MAEHREELVSAPRQERDRIWVARLRNGDADVIAEIFDAYYTPLRRYTEKIVHSPEIARDIVADMFHALWVKREQFQPVDLWPYLVTVTRNLALRRMHRANREASVTSLLAAAGATPELGTTGSESPDDELIAAEDARHLEERIGRLYAELPPRTREVLALWANSMNYKDIARVLGIATKTVDAHLQHAKRTIRRILARAD